MREALLRIINDILDRKGEPLITEFSPSLNLRNDANLSSFDLAELTVRIEDQFGIDIFKDGLVNTIGEIEEILMRETIVGKR